MHKLTGEQCKILYFPDKHLSLLGSAGSGKSLIALYKAIYYTLKYPNKKGMICCFNRPVIDKIKNDLSSIVSELGLQEDEISTKLEIETYYTYIQSKVNMINQKNSYFISEGREMDLKSPRDCDRKSWIEIAKQYVRKKHENSRVFDRAISFFADEISWLQGMRVTSLDEYQNLERIGRGRKDPVNKGVEREILYDIFLKYKEIRLQKGKYFDYDDVSWKLLEVSNYLPEDEKLDYLIIDEFQDMDKSKIQALVSTVRKDGFIIFLGDYAQQILGTRISYKQLGVGRITKVNFVKNYRNTKEISKLANSLFERGLISEEDDEKIDRVEASRSGNTPILKKVSSYNYPLKEFFTDKSGTNGIILMNKDKYKKVCEIIKVQSLNVELYTINQVKGLEFDNVLVLDVDDIVYLEELENIENNENAEVAKQLYVAITRARNNLCMFFTNYDMSYFIDKELLKIEI